MEELVTMTTARWFAGVKGNLLDQRVQNVAAPKVIPQQFLLFTRRNAIQREPVIVKAIQPWQRVDAKLEELARLVRPIHVKMAELVWISVTLISVDALKDSPDPTVKHLSVLLVIV